MKYPYITKIIEVIQENKDVKTLKFEHENRVGASLGQDSIDKGTFSCVVALLLLLLFSIFYYRLPGIFAICALFYNLFLIMLFLSYFESALTWCFYFNLWENKRGAFKRNNV